MNNVKGKKRSEIGGGQRLIWFIDRKVHLARAATVSPPLWEVSRGRRGQRKPRGSPDSGDPQCSPG